MSNPCFNSQSKKIYVESWGSYAEFPIAGNTYTIYIDENTNSLYHWNGSAYEEVGQYPAVDYYANLPTLPNVLYNDKIYRVRYSSGVRFVNYHASGFYSNDGVTWDSTPMIAGALTTGDVKDDLISTDTNKPLSANQGLILKGLIDGITSTILDTIDDEVNALIQDNTGIAWTYDDTLNTLTPVLNDNLIDIVNANPTSGNLLIGSGTAWVSNAMSGDITISNTGVTAIGASKVTNTMLAGGIGNSKLDVIETAKGGTGLTTYTLGDTLYCSAGNILAKLAGNTTTTKKFLSQTGDGTISAAPSWSTVVKGDVGLGNVDNTSDANKPISSATQTALNNKEPTITAGTTTQYWRGDKSWQTLPVYTAGTGLTLVGNQFSIPTSGVNLNQIQTIYPQKVLGNNGTASAAPNTLDIVDIVGSGPISVSNGAYSAIGIVGFNTTISIQQADATHDGYITQGKYNAFDNKFGDQASQFSVLTAKSTLVDGDILCIEDSAASNAKKKTLMSNVWTYINSKTNIVQGTATQVTVNTTTPTTIASATINIKKNTSKILIMVSGDANPNQDNGWHYIKLYRDTTVLNEYIILSNDGKINSSNTPFAKILLDSPSTTGNVTYYAKAFQGSGSFTYGEEGANEGTTIIVQEIYQ